MSNLESNQTIADKELFIKMVLSNWDMQIIRFNSLLAKLSDQELSQETAPERNTGFYLLGHLAAISDSIFTFLGLREMMDPAMYDVFVDNPENSGTEKPTIEELKRYWDNVNAELAGRISKMKPDEWFERHTKVSEEDFAKEPHRNKLNIIINRTGHLSYHLGQMAYLAKK